jgi:nucleoid DNA-binding protein
MDIAKYIGSFLLKNHFCYVHGLGNMELKKRPATYDGKSLNPHSYEVIVTPGGSIDDNLANFIATNEQISISKAANALREYSIDARKDMAAGKEVPIPNIGCFVEEHSRVKFVTNEQFRFTPASLPTIRNSKQLDEQNARLAHKPSYPPPHKADSVNWSMVILVCVLLIIIGGGIYGIYYYSGQNKNSNNVPLADTVVKVQAPPPVDTTHVQKDTVTTSQVPVVDSNAISSYKMVIGDYSTMAKAERRQKSLQLNGTHVEVVPMDSANFFVVAAINCKAADTAHVKDSLRVWYGYKGVVIYK